MEEVAKPKPADEPKQRKCLKCGDTFTSEWIGARICTRCKSGSAWRESRVTTFSPSHRKR